jgi:hypothetical protein
MIRSVAEGNGEDSDLLKTVGQALALVAGFVALIYAAGGSVLVLRLFAEGLPSRTVVGQLPRDLLISVGLAQIVLPALAVAAIYGAVRLLWKTPPPTRLVKLWKSTSSDELEPEARRSSSWLILFSVAAVPAAALTVIAGFRLQRAHWLLIFSFLLTFLVTLVALNLTARLAMRYPTSSAWNARRPILLMALVVAFAVLPACLVLAGTINLLSATACLTNGSQVPGLLVGETNDRVYIGDPEYADLKKTKKYKKRDVYSIPLSHVKATLIGGRTTAHCPRQ